MIQENVAKFNISYKQILNQEGKLVGNLPAFAQKTENLIKLYQHMWLTRLFDAKAISLQRTGKLGTYPSTLGQEAIGTAVGSAMRASDVLCPYYRENAAQFWRGVTLEEILLFWGGNELGMQFSGPQQDLPICIPIGSQNLHAVGVATAMMLRKEKRAALAFVGDGGTSRGDFYEAMNVAGVWKLPVVFVINNNQWAISVPSKAQTAAVSFAQKSIAAGIPGEQVDGNDVLVVHQAVTDALAKAYCGEGATVIEAITYRMCDHTTADDAKRYRQDTELNIAKDKDPIKRLKIYLMNQQLWDESKEAELQQTLGTQIKVAVDKYLQQSKQNPESMFDYLYATLPTTLDMQRKQVL